MTRLTRVAFAAALILLPASVQAQEAKPLAKAQAKASIYDVKADAREQVKAAGLKAGRDNQRILVMFGGDWCGWCHKLHELMKSDRGISKTLREDYQLVMVDTKAPNAEELLAECAKDVTGLGYPFLAVLDAQGKILTRQKTDPLEEGDHHDPKKVQAFLDEWAPEKVSADKVLEAALAKASSEDKRVLLHFGAPWCGWCHKLDGFLAREEIAKVVGKDYLDVKIDVDRMPGGKAILAKYCKTEGGIPWTVILDAKGEPIVNSDGADGKNIGYPASAAEIAHFMSMLKKTAKKLDDADLKAIEDALKSGGKKIEEAKKERVARPATPARIDE